MKRFILAPDSFKGTLSSATICTIMERVIGRQVPGAEIISIPVADGGEGSVDCFLRAVAGERVSCKTKNPLFEEIEGVYGLLDDGQTAVIEMAACAGLPLVEGRKNPMLTTTYGVGLLMRDALARGVTRIILCLGGSATNDFGCGAAAALGISFFDEEGRSFVPTGGTLSKVARVARSAKTACLNGVEISLMCDVKNPVYGPRGAAYVYAPQKGATEAQVRLLDDGLRHICEVVRRDLGRDVSALVGGGAAGAMAGGMVAFFDATIRMGIDVVLDTVGFDRLLERADVVFTGEGKLDAQSLQGKVVYGVANRARAKGVPVIAVVGGIDGDLSAMYEAGVTSAFAINCLPEDFSVSRHKSEQNLQTTMENILRALHI